MQELKVLLDRYPALFTPREDDDMPNVVRAWGFECGDGWFSLLDTLCAEITAHAQANGLEITVRQIKEKFGALRFYLGGGDEFIGGLVSLAGRLSEHVCEECGKPGWMSASGWMKVRCAEHGGKPTEGERAPAAVGYVVGKSGVRVKSDADLAIAGKPQPEPVFRLPEIRTERFRAIASELEKALDLDIRRNGMPMVTIDAVIEGDALAFRWHGGDDEGRAAGLFRFAEAFSARV